MRLTYAIGAIALALVLFQPPSEAQVKVTFGKKKPVTDKNGEVLNEIGANRNTAPVFIDKDLAAKVHTVAVLTIAGPPKVSLGVKSGDATPLLAHAETQLVSLLTAAGYTVQPLDKTRELVKQQWVSTYVDAMPQSEREKLANISQEEKEAYIKNNIFAKLNQKLGGGDAEEGTGGKWDKSSPSTFYLSGMTTYLYDLGGGGMTAGEALLPMELRVAGGLAEKLGADAVVILTAHPAVEENKANRLHGKIQAKGDEHAVETVRLQVVNPDAQFVFAECYRSVHKKALSKGAFAFSYNPEEVVNQLTDQLDEALQQELKHFSGK